MKRNATQSTIESKNHGARFVAVLDSRKRKIRGLWIRSGKYYLQTRVDQGGGKSSPRKIALEAKTLDAAKTEAERLRTENRAGEMHEPGHRPKFVDLVVEYKASAVFKAKKIGTRENETQALNRWTKQIGHIRIDWLTTDELTKFHASRKNDGVSERTINLDTVAFNNAMKFAVARQWLTKPPRVAKLKERKAPVRKLLSSADVQRLIASSTSEVTKNAGLFSYYLRFMAYSGSREQEALQVRIADVDLDRGVVHIGGTGDTKNSLGRDVQFNTSLKAAVQELLAALPPDTKWLFPSPQRGERDRPAKRLRNHFT